MNGTIAGETITGTIGPSTLTCNGIPFTIQGKFTASKTSKALVSGAPISEYVQTTVQQTVDP